MSTVEGKKQEKRRALLDAAYELFLERGTSKTSVEDITSRAKVGKGTFSSILPIRVRSRRPCWPG